METLTFDQWIYKVCELIATRYKRDITDVYVSLNLSDCKLQFADGVSPENFNL